MEVPCDLTLSDLRTRVLERLDDNGTYYLTSEITHALNVGQHLWALITLCIERSVTFTLTSGQAFYLISSQITDFLKPLRVQHSSGRVMPSSVHELNSLNASWRSTAGSPTRYAQLGADIIAFTPQATSGSVTLTYAAEPSVMSNDSDVPEIAQEQQIFLADFACWFLRLREGGQELQNATQYLQRFLEAAEKYQGFVRNRSYAQRYDSVAFDLQSFDRGKLALKLLKQPQARMK